jgi:hypothetical protein
MQARVRGTRRVGSEGEPCRSPPFRRGERVGLTGQRGQGGGDLGETGADIGRRGADITAAVGMAGVGAGDAVSEIPLTGRERFTNPAEYLSPTSGR